MNIAATILSNVLIDRVGRKILLYASDIGMVISLIAFGGYFYAKDVERVDPPGKHILTRQDRAV